MKLSEMSNDSTLKTFIVAGGLCLVCSIVVSAAAVGLKPRQIQNQIIDQQRNVLKVAGQYQDGIDIATAFAKFEPRVVELATGKYVEGIDAAAFDQTKAAKDPATNVELSSADDIAKIKRHAKQAKIYLLKDAEGKVEQYILPVKGYGLWSTLYGYIALESDAQTVKGLVFYQHAETPGLGGEVDNPIWRAQWPGKKVYDAEGNVALGLVKSVVDPTSPKAMHQVDGLAGATLTGRGVTNLVQFWLGENGFKKYLSNIRS